MKTASYEFEGWVCKNGISKKTIKLMSQDFVRWLKTKYADTNQKVKVTIKIWEIKE
jgi:hypothetical protein